MLTPEQIEEIRGRYIRPTAYEGAVAVYGSGLHQTRDDMAALLDHCDRFSALTPEVVETACESLDHSERITRYAADATELRYAEKFAAARAVLESLK